MTQRIKLVQGDQLLQIIGSITEDDNGAPVNLAGAVCRLKFRQEGETTILFVSVGANIPGLEDEDGNVNTDPPYDVPGSGGRVAFVFPQDALNDVEPGNYEGEVEVSFVGGAVQTVEDIAKFKVREDF